MSGLWGNSCRALTKCVVSSARLPAGRDEPRPLGTRKSTGVGDGRGSDAVEKLAPNFPMRRSASPASTPSVLDKRIAVEISRHEDSNIGMENRAASQQVIRPQWLAAEESSLELVEREPALVEEEDQLIAPCASRTCVFPALVCGSVQKRRELSDITKQCHEIARRPAADFECGRVACNRLCAGAPLRATRQAGPGRQVRLPQADSA